MDSELARNGNQVENRRHKTHTEKLKDFVSRYYYLQVFWVLNSLWIKMEN